MTNLTNKIFDGNIDKVYGLCIELIEQHINCSGGCYFKVTIRSVVALVGGIWCLTRKEREAVYEKLKRRFDLTDYDIDSTDISKEVYYKSLKKYERNW